MTPTLLTWYGRYRARILSFLGLFVAVLVMVAIAQAVQPRVISIETEPIPTLYPHGHSADVDRVTDVGHAEYAFASATTTEDLWISRIEVIVHNAPMTVLHHTTLLSFTDEEDPFCPGSVKNVIYASLGEESPSVIEFPAPYGMFVPKGTVLHVMTMLHNAFPPMGRGGTYHNVSTEFRVTAIPHHQNRYRDVLPIKLALRTLPYCAWDIQGLHFDVPPYSPHHLQTPGPTEPDHARYTFTEDGTIIAAGGHTHPWDGGKWVQLFRNNELIQTYTPVPNEDLGRQWLTPAVSINQRVSAGDELTITALYENDGPKPVLGAMGIVQLYFAPDP